MSRIPASATASLAVGQTTAQLLAEQHEVIAFGARIQHIEDGGKVVFVLAGNVASSIFVVFGSLGCPSDVLWGLTPSDTQ
ncbi:hypothetical protein FN846DRAFT_914041 [Sphaerosporella brunnea]|uniref:Uncharacterized protein n=1 Tax=Sphaerosporella brunnea TaxID=1250544 RepID=A0A5J5ED10_9PEZI|nr:hypothetical protein FN846DRAFT_914041 [Sphaerosporella brunnea]